MIVDRFNRVHNYLRISITDNCNLRCFYCMPEEDYDFTPASRLMQREEIYGLAKVFVDEGVTRIRLTGGEPLVRKDGAAIVRSLSTLPVDLTLTTNATRLKEFIPVLKEANIKSINISLDTLDSDKFLFLTRRDMFSTVQENIELAIAAGFNVKINMVVMKGFNDNEINDFINWSRDTPVHIRFIEFMPFTGNKWTSNKVFSLDEILGRISTQFAFEPLTGNEHDTAKLYKIEGHSGSFGVISTMTSPFCSGCNRLRLTADGKLKNCLFSRGETDLLTAYRQGKDIRPLIHSNIELKEKELGGQFNSSLQQIEAMGIENRSMITIGG